MKKNLLKYIFITMITVCISFMFIGDVSAQTVEIKLTGDTRDEVYYTHHSGIFWINFNKNKKYGGVDAANDACKNVCGIKCVDMGFGAAAGCEMSTLKPTVTVDMGEKYPIKLTYDDATINSPDAKIITKDCFMTYHVSSGNKEMWGCKSRGDCVNGCAGNCVPRTIKFKDANGDVSKGTAYFCPDNNVKPNLFVDVNGQLMAWDSVHKTPEEAIVVTGENESLIAPDEWMDIPALLDGISNIENGDINCNDEALLAVITFAQKIFGFMRIGAVILLIVLTSIDFMGSVAADDSNALKKATQKFVKRAIFTIALMILPSLINLIFAIVTIKEGMCVIS